MKIVVAHPFQQHSFKTAAAVKDSRCLYKYITTVYLKKGTWTYCLSKIFSGDNLSRICGRRTELLEDNEVKTISEWANLLLLLLQRIDKSKKIYNWWYKCTLSIFNRKLFQYIKKNNIDAVIVYDTLASQLIERIKREKLSCKVILDMSAPNANYMNYIFSEEKKNCNLKFFGNVKKVDQEYHQYKCDAAMIEIKNADAFLVASDFTSKSLKWEGVSDDRIYKCIYGVYSPQRENYINNGNTIKCCFVGKVSMEKGAHHLFNVINKLKRTDMEFHFFGSYDQNAEYYLKYKSTCKFHGHIPHSQMLSEMKKMDIIIFPSLADGFGLSVTEGLLSNCIAICSTNAGVSELIIDGVNGYKYFYDEEDTLLKLLENLSFKELRNMQSNAPESISKYTWNSYFQSIKRMIEKLEEGNGL